MPLIYSDDGSWRYNEYFNTIKSIVINEGITSVHGGPTIHSSGAFASCTTLLSVTLPSTLKTIGSHAFDGCSSISKITIPSSVTTIARGAFKGCTGLRSIEIPDSVTVIENDAFSGCSALQKVKLSENMTSIGAGAFSGCTVLSDITIPGRVAEIGDSAFKRCTALRTAVISDGVITIGNNAFEDCTALRSIEIPQSVSTIKGFAFYKCKALQSISLGNNLTIIGERAFSECTTLPEITIPGNVITIGGFAFRDCTSLKNVWIEDGVMELKGGVFYGCTRLESIVIPDSVTVLENTNYYGCFKYCTALKTAILGEGMPYIPEEFFQGCTSLINVEIKNGVSSIGNEAFIDCSSLEAIVIPDNVTSIGDDAFANCIKLNSIQLGSGLLSIGDRAFKGCSRLAKIDLPDNVDSIGKFAFRDCTALKRIDIPDEVRQIVGDPFTGCDSLNSVIIPKEVTYVDFDLGSCRELKLVYLKSLDIAENLTEKDSASGLISNAETIILPDGIAATNYIKGSYPFTGTAIIYGESVNWYKKTEECAVHFYEDDEDTDCNICGYTRIVEEPSSEVPSEQPSDEPSENPSEEPSDEPSENPSQEHVHSVEGWKNDKTQHWHECTVCGEKLDTADHIYDDEFDAECNVCGAIRSVEPTLDLYNLGDETYSFGNYGDSDSLGGHCFGMSITSAGYHNNLLDVSIIGGNANTSLYSLSKTQAVTQPICYYQGIQGSYSARAIVAGGSFYLTDASDISTDWEEVVDYVKNHYYDGTGILQIGFRKDNEGGHAINFLRYENVNGQDRIYAYDNNFPEQETYFYQDSSGRVWQAPKQTFSGAIDCIALRDCRTYLNSVGTFDATHVLYMAKDAATVQGDYTYSYMEAGFSDEEYVMYEIPADVNQVTIIPHRDNAEFVYMDTTYSFGEITDETHGVLTFASDNSGTADTDAEFEMYEVPTLGDANGDGGVNNIDASLALQYDSGLINLEEAAFAAADVDGNGGVNNIDASLMLQFDSGIISGF